MDGLCNSPAILAAARGLADTLVAPGGYFLWWKIVIAMIFVVPWLWLAPKVQKDAKAVRLPKRVQSKTRQP